MNKKSQSKVVVILFSIIILIFLIILVPKLNLRENINQQGNSKLHSRGANYDIYREPSGQFRKVIYSGAVNVLYNETYIPFTEYVDVTEEDGKLKIQTKDGEYCYFKLKYKLKDDKDKDKEKKEINITEYKHNYYFTTKIDKKVDDMAYELNCSGFNIDYIDNKLFLNNISIDFNQAKKEQNISTTYNKTTKKLEFKPVSGKTADLSYIDPNVLLQDADTENLEDSMVSESAPSTNYGSSFTISVGTDSEVNSERLYFEFNISSIFDNSYDITFANFSFYSYYITYNFVINAHHVYDSIDESTITWNNQPCGVNFDDSGSCNLTLMDNKMSAYNAWVSFNVLSGVKTALGKGDDFLGIALRNDTLSNWKEVYTYSKEHSIAALRPKLEITYDDLIVNEPDNNEVIANNLSFQLNTSQARYNNTVWYSWNNGIINNTLCTDSNECEGMITFPRQGIYDLIVWGNKSDGTIKNVTITNIFVGNTSAQNLNSPYEGVSMWAYTNDRSGSPSPPNLTHPYTSETDSTADANLNALDNNFLSLQTTGDDRIKYGLIVVNDTLTTTNQNITLIIGSAAIRWWDAISSNAVDSSFKVYIWNATSSSWLHYYTATTEHQSTTVAYNILKTSDVSDFLNDSGFYHFLYYAEVHNTNYVMLDIDYLQFNMRTRDFNINPSLNLLTPNNTNFSYSTSVNVSYNYTDDNDYVKNISLYLDGTINQTRINGIDFDTNLNFTIPSIADGVHTYYIVVTDSDNVKNTSETRTFTVDTTPPISTVSVTSPPDGASYTFDTWSANNVKATITAYDSGIGYDNLAYPLYCTDTTNTCNPTTYISSGTTISTEGISYIRFYSNDTLDNMETIQSRTLKIDSINPNLTIDYPTNNLNLSQSSINFNITIAESGSGMDSCLYSLNSGTNNYTMSNTSATEYNATNSSIGDGTYTANFYCNDSVNNLNNSESIVFTIDTTKPVTTFAYPLNISYSENVSAINYTYTELNCQNVWYSTDGGSTNQTPVSCGTNFTTITSTEGSNTWILYMNDSASNENSTSLTFFKDSINPDISIATPTNNTNSTNNQLNINCTISDTNLDSCWWTNNSGKNNYTLASCVNITTETWADGTHNLIIYANDSLNNQNSSSVTFTIDTTAPSLSIVHPVDLASYSTSTISLNYTVSDSGIGLNTCWFRNDTDINNITIACGTNTSISQGADGTYNIYMWANDTLGNEVSDSHQYTISTLAPAISLVNPSNEEILNTQTLWFNYTASDSNGVDTCQLWGNWSGGWHLNQSNVHGGDTSVDVNEGNFTQIIADGLYKWNIWCNDTNPTADFSATNLTFLIDSTYPLIDFDAQTPTNNTNSTDTNLYVNITYTEINLDSIVFLLYDSSGEVNKTTFNTATYQINWTDLPDEIYTYNVTINDTAGNTNSTETRIRRLDDTAPTITILKPLAQNYGTNNSMSLNYSSTDNVVGLDKCWYFIQNSSGYLIKPTETLSSCQNDTFTLPRGDIDYTLSLFAKDLLNNTQSASVTFGIRTESPVIVLTTINDTHTNTITDNYFNFTVETNADNISACELWGNWSGGWHLNQTINNPSESIDTNFSKLTIPEGKYFWNVNCSDNLGFTGWALNNNTFVVDLTFPEINITYITTIAGSQTIKFNTSTSDLNPVTCKYSIYDNSGLIDGINENVSFNCNEEESATVTTFATYTLKTYVKDKAGNENSTSKSFITSPSTTKPGGGGTTVIKGRSTLEATNFTITTTNLNSQMDMILAKDSARPRTKKFMLSNDGIEEIKVNIICDTQNVNESSQNIDICNYVFFEENNFLVSPNLENRPIGEFSVLTPNNSKFGDEYFFNILAIRTVEGETRFSKLSVRTRVTFLASLIKWSKVPGIKQLIIVEKGKVDGSIYPVTPVALIISLISSVVVFLIFRRLKIPTAGFFISVVLFVLIFILLLFVL